MKNIKVIYSLWTKPLICNDDNLGFNTIEDFISSLILTVNVTRQNYENIHFYTDEYGMELIKPHLKELPFTEIHVILDNLNWVPSQWWAFPKMYVYGLQKTPFIHIDNDAFLWDKITIKDFIDNDVVCQHLEDFKWEGHNFYYDAIKFYKKHINKEMTKTRKYHYAMNAGVFGALNERGVELFSSLYRHALKSAKSVLQDKWICKKVINFDNMKDWHAFLWNLITEQAYANYYCEKYNLKILQILNTKTRFTHLLAGAKRNIHNINKIEQRVLNKNWKPFDI